MESAWRHSWWEQPLARCHSQRGVSRGRAGTREEQSCVVGSEQAKSACAKQPPLCIRERTIYIYFYIYHILYTLLMADSSHVQGTRARDLFYVAQSGKIAL